MSFLIDKYNTVNLFYNKTSSSIEIKELIGFDLHHSDYRALKRSRQQYMSCLQKQETEHQPDGMSVVKMTEERSSHTFSSKELIQMADILLGKSHSSRATTLQSGIRAKIKRVDRALSDYKLIMDIADFMVEKQQQYLLTQDWLHLNRLTTSEVSNAIEYASESTVSRRIKAINFRLNDSKIPASDLICSNNLPFICRQIKHLRKKHLNAARPLLYRLLKEEGYSFSDGQIGKALRLLKRIDQLKIIHHYSEG